MEEFVWCKEGLERCERTPRFQQVQAQAQQVQPQQPPQQVQAQIMPAQAQEALLNKRESASAKINERYLVGQPIQNPFMPNSNYITDLEVQMNFLTPQKSASL